MGITLAAGKTMDAATTYSFVLHFYQSPAAAASDITITVSREKVSAPTWLWDSGVSANVSYLDNQLLLTGFAITA